MHAAVFVDFENLFHSLRNRAALTGIRTRDLCLAILESLKTRLQAENCPIVLGRSYAAFDTYPGMEVAHDLALMGLDPQYVLVGHSGKNSADVQLAVDVSRVLFRRPDIDAIVIVSGDRDFIPVARQVLEENRELRVVAIPDTTSGDLRMRVGKERFWDALDLVPVQARSAPDTSPADGNGSVEPLEVDADGSEPAGAVEAGETPPSRDNPLVPLVPGADPRGESHVANIVGHIPVTWKTNEVVSRAVVTERLTECLELIVRAQLRHGTREVWLSPFLKGPMSQHFSNLVHPERRALINELRSRGVIRVEERENMFADHPYSVIVLEEQHPLAVDTLDRMRRQQSP
jgi:NYN domain